MPIREWASRLLDRRVCVCEGRGVPPWPPPTTLQGLRGLASEKADAACHAHTPCMQALSVCRDAPASPPTTRSPTNKALLQAFRDANTDEAQGSRNTAIFSVLGQAYPAPPSYIPWHSHTWQECAGGRVDKMGQCGHGEAPMGANPLACLSVCSRHSLPEHLLVPASMSRVCPGWRVCQTSR